jgi:hypothetical protein
MNKVRTNKVNKFYKELVEARDNLKDDQVMRVTWNYEDKKEATLFEINMGINLWETEDGSDIELITRYGRGDFYWGTDDWNWENITDPKIEIVTLAHDKFDITCVVCQEISYGHVNDDGVFEIWDEHYPEDYNLNGCKDFGICSSEHNDDRIRVIV